MTIAAIAEKASDVPLFARLPKDSFRVLEQHLTILSFAPGERILREGDANPGRFYLVLEGEAGLCKSGQSIANKAPVDYEIAVRRKHEVFGSISFLDGQPFSSGAVAKTPLTLAVVDFSTSRLSQPSRKLHATLIAALRTEHTSDLRHSISDRVDRLREEAEFMRYKSALGSIVIMTLSLLAFYTLLLSALPKFELVLAVNFAISPFIIALFALVLGAAILRSGFPAAFFGIQTANWKHAVGFAVTTSLAFILAGALLKWTLIQNTESFSNLSVFGVADVKVNMHDVMMSPLYWVAVGLYLILTPIQEFVARCCLQAPLYAFLTGSEFRRRLWSILVSNLVFAAAHSHISFAFALAAFIPGIFWGWIFARTNSLYAAAVSHFLIGGAGIFLFGIEDFIAKLAG